MSPIYVPGKLVLRKDYVEGDRNFSNVSLLLHGDGTNGSTTIIDSSPLAQTMTVFGNAQISTAQSKFGGSSLFFDGTGDSIRSSQTANWTFGANNFTIECWLNTSDTGQYGSIVSADGTGTNGWAFLVNSATNDGKIVFYEGAIASSLLISSSGGFNNNAWHHVAVARNGSNLSIYVNGTSLASSTSSSSATTPGTLYIGGSMVSAGRDLVGYIDDLRITKGIARYTANFTPPTAPFADAQF